MNSRSLLLPPHANGPQSHNNWRAALELVTLAMTLCGAIVIYTDSLGNVSKTASQEKSYASLLAGVNL